MRRDKLSISCIYIGYWYFRGGQLVGNALQTTHLYIRPSLGRRAGLPVSTSYIFQDALQVNRGEEVNMADGLRLNNIDLLEQVI